MTVIVFWLNVIVIIFPVVCPSVVRRIDVNGVDLVAMRIGEHFKRVEVLTVDDRMARPVTTSLNATGFD